MRNFVKYMALAGILAIAGCREQETPTFTAKSMLYIQQEDFADGESIDLAHLTKSFASYAGASEMEVSFKVNLIGHVTGYDRPFEVAVVEEETTAEENEYEIETPVLKAGEITTDLKIKLFKTPRMDEEKVTLTILLLAGKHFNLGYEDQLTAQVIYDNTPLKPEWWTEFIALCYLGEYTPAKYNAFYNYCGLTDISDLEPSELRELVLGFKEYIEENGITEEDGSPMELPII
ncbi:MAG: DUF4843 domain-containing protein [Candidatus Cryptobacteroides sp.]|nr:DUF4843 domain-containing protein [Bacteroidales bacterium]MDY5442012.1 DUF4843 domain-containing protein [Candidatus Cryptobacteroides sp.]MDY6183656.1 DUF4843 domain-containing protein [Candidatus Cryptobacteroides sp.]